MNYQINHQIQYVYSAPVFLEPHVVRLHPRTDHCQQNSDFMMNVTPRPVGINSFLDAEGNLAACLWFEELTESLTISTSFTVQTLCANPFNYLVVDQDFLELPAIYPEHDAASLASFLNTDNVDPEVTAFGQSIRQQVNGNTLDFLNRLCATIYNDFTVEIRDTGSTLSPETTLQSNKGACRDLAWLFVAVCRSVGLAGRFVSGYQEGDSDMDNRHLHAWTEVYIPGGGWRGYDPTLGLAVADRHIPLAASHHPEGAAAVIGTFRGTDITTDMHFNISLTGNSTF